MTGQLRGGTADDELTRYAHTRMARLLIAVQWTKESLLEHTWKFVHERMENPEEEFGPAAIMSAIAPEDPAVREWIAALSEDTRRLLALVTGLPASVEMPTLRR